MSVALAEVQAVAPWRIELMKEIQMRGGFPEGGATKFIKEFAEVYSMSLGTVNSAFYTLKNKTDNFSRLPELLEEYGRAAAESQEMQDQQGQVEEVIDEPAEGASVVTEKPQNTQQEEPAPKADAQPGVIPTDAQENKKPSTKSPAMIGNLTVGQTYELDVVDVHSYGAWVKLVNRDLDDREGIIHISQVKNEFVSDIHKFFQFGDTVRAKLIGYIVDKDRLNFSTRDLPLVERGIKGANMDAYRRSEEVPSDQALLPQAPAVNSLADKLAAFKDQINTVPTPEVNTVEQELRAPSAPSLTTVASASVIEEPKTDMSAVITRLVTGDERDQVKEFITQALGVNRISTRGEAALTALIAQHGMFKFSLVLGQVLPGFEIDPVAELAKEIEQKLGGSL